MRSVERAFDILEIFADRREPLGLSEIASTLGIPVSTCFDLLRTLQSRGYLYEVGKHKTYFPTARWLEKSTEIAASDQTLKRLQRSLASLRDETGETILLGKRLRDKVIYLSVAAGTHTIRYSTAVGELKPLHSSALGKALLGAMPPKERERLVNRLKLPRITDLTITRRAKLMADIEAGQSRGWFITRGENVDEVMGIAVPFHFNSDVFAIAIAGPITRLDSNLPTYVKRLVATCKSAQMQRA